MSPFKNITKTGGNPHHFRPWNGDGKKTHPKRPNSSQSLTQLLQYQKGFCRVRFLKGLCWFPPMLMGDIPSILANPVLSWCISRKNTWTRPMPSIPGIVSAVPILSHQFAMGRSIAKWHKLVYYQSWESKTFIFEGYDGYDTHICRPQISSCFMDFRWFWAKQFQLGGKTK